MRLTESMLEGLRNEGRDRIIFDRLVQGFGIRITAAGTKLYIVQARIGGRARRVSLGAFPTKPLTKAREEARVALLDMRKGLDPLAERTARTKAIEAGTLTVSSLADRWLAEYVRPKLKPRTVLGYESLLKQHVRPRLGHLPVATLSKAALITLHADLQNTPGRANRTIACVRALMTFAEDVGLRPQNSNPASKIKLYRERARERFLSEAELGRAADAITTAERGGKIGPHGAAGLRLALFTGARSGEITAIRWEHIDRERRLIRLPDSKSNEPRTIHLSQAALEILAGVQRVGPYVIAGASQGEPLKNLSRCWIVARKYGRLEDVRLHDLRHSFASLAASRGVSLQMIGKLLGHKVFATTLRYAHLTRDAVAAVNDDLAIAITAAVENGEKTEPKVVKLRRKRPSR